MSEYKEYIEEKQMLERYFELGYKVTAINENLSGMYIEFSSPESIQQTILLTTAEARKLIATKLFYA
ncbi:MAG: hypothetical protein ABS882_02170 [Lysinibacillus sp.]